MKKPRSISNQSGTLACHESAKGKRTVEINMTNEAMPVAQAKTVCQRLTEMIAWCG